MNAAVSVVIPTYKRPDLLGRCLDAVLTQDFAAPYEVIVVDDEPSDDSRRVVEGLCDQRVRYLANDGRHGPAAARNRGWRAADAPIIAFTDDDCLPSRTWLTNGIQAMQEGFAGVSGRIVVPTRHPPSDYELTTSGLEHSCFVTANCFYRKEVLAAIDGFDERFTAAWREDADVEFSLRERGESLGYAPEAVVVHPVRPAPWGISLHEQRKSMFNALLYEKHPHLYRDRIQGTPPLRYYAILATLAVMVGAIVSRRGRLAMLLGLFWWLQTALFAFERLRRTSHRPSHALEMAVTSALIPGLSVFWRLRGAVRFRVLFL